MRIGNASEAAQLLAPLFLGSEGERVAVLHLGRLQEVLALTLERSNGGPDEVDLPVSGILSSALRIGAQNIIIAHNHPSGDSAPSPADMDATRRLADTCRTVGIRLFDHLIFASGNCRSFRAEGLL